MSSSSWQCHLCGTVYAPWVAACWKHSVGVSGNDYVGPLGAQTNWGGVLKWYYLAPPMPIMGEIKDDAEKGDT